MKHLVQFASALALMLSAFPFSIEARAEVFEYGDWSYACMKDHTDAYGTVLNERNCWASICKIEGGYGCLSVFSFQPNHTGLARDHLREACDYPPHRIAVDGVRIDELSDEAQIAAVLKGKSIIREEQKRGWPYCDFQDISASLKGSSEVYKRLVKLRNEFFDDQWKPR